MPLIVRRLPLTRRAALTAVGTVAAGVLARKPAGAQGSGAPVGVLVQTKPPQPMPALSFVAADGSTVALSAFAGRGVVLNCWATWCSPCVKEMPALAAMAAKLRDAGIVVLAASSDRGGAPAVERFYDDHSIKGLDVWLDPHGDATHALSLRGIPTTLVIDRAGREQARAEGAVEWAAVEVVERVRALVVA